MINNFGHNDHLEDLFNKLCRIVTSIDNKTIECDAAAEALFNFNMDSPSYNSEFVLMHDLLCRLKLNNVPEVKDKLTEDLKKLSSGAVSIAIIQHQEKITETMIADFKYPLTKVLTLKYLLISALHDYNVDGVGFDGHGSDYFTLTATNYLIDLRTEKAIEIFDTVSDGNIWKDDVADCFADSLNTVLSGYGSGIFKKTYKG